MAAKTIQGVGGSITLPTGFGCKFNAFTCDVDLRETDTTGFIDVGWFTYEVTFMDLSGTATGTMQYDDANTTPLPATLVAATPAMGAAVGSIVLTWMTGCTWTFNGIVNRFSGSRPATDKATATYNFRHQSGGVTQVWDTSGV